LLTSAPRPPSAIEDEHGRNEASDERGRKLTFGALQGIMVERRGMMVVLPPDFLIPPPRRSSMNEQEVRELELLQASFDEEELVEFERRCGSVPGPPPLPVPPGDHFLNQSRQQQYRATARRATTPPALAHMGKQIASMGTAARKGFNNLAEAFHSRCVFYLSSNVDWPHQHDDTFYA